MFDVDGTTADAVWTGVHAALLRGRGDTAIVLHYTDDKKARALLIPRDSSLMRAGFTNPSWTATNLQASFGSTLAGIDLFCGGHVTLPTGELLLASGTEKGINGHRLCRLFRPDSIRTSSKGWSLTDSLLLPRWYPTLTVLGDGRVAAHSGFHYYEMMMFGGDASTGLSDSTISMPLERDPYWGERPSPISDSHTGGGSRPSARSDAAGDWASLIMPLNAVRGAVVMFGGKNGGTTYGDLWLSWRVGVHGQESWYSYQPLADAAAPVAERVLPPARSEHALAIRNFNDTAFVYVYGGKDAGGAVLRDMWQTKIYRKSYAGFASDVVYRTRQLDASALPGYRYGHSMVFDAGPLTGVFFPARPMLLVFGGKTTGGALADNEAFAYHLTRQTWQQLDVGPWKPAARYRHRSVFVPVISGEYNQRALKGRMFMFGGEDASGTTRYGDLWRLSRCNDSLVTCTTYVWKQWTPGGSPSPIARSGHSLIWDLQWRRLLMFGGAKGTGSGDRLADTWFLPIDHTDTCSSTPDSAACSSYYWRQASATSYVPAARAGHVGVYYQNVTVNTRRPEVYDPTAPAGSKWSYLVSGGNNASHFSRETYPFMFLLPSGNLFQAGRDEESVTNANVIDTDGSGTYVLRTSGASPGWNDPIASPFHGSSAVMYRPGKILKCGDGVIGGDPAKDTTLVIDVSSVGQEGTATWSRLIPGIGQPWMRRRVEPNIALLPTGDVLALGGRRQHSDQSDAELKPQILRIGSMNWTDGLADAPVPRGYHSTAVLLPDARVVCMGGNNSATDALDKAFVFEPPYLFDGDVLATRPEIQCWPSNVYVGRPFQVRTDRAGTIVSACLIRPAATTHAFDQNQVYVPLTPERVGTTDRVSLTITSNANEVPPGDYMLFVVDTVSAGAGRVPSYARWVRVSSTSAVDHPTRVTNLVANGTTPTTAVLSWGHPQGDSLNSCVVATQYEVHYKTSSMPDWASFSTGTVAPSPPTPGEAGDPITMAVADLTPETPYYFRLITKDASNTTGNWSAMSNEATVTLSGAGGGGGRDPGDLQHLQADDPRGPSAFAVEAMAETTYLENTLLAHVAPNQVATDRLLLKYGPKWVGDTARVRVSRNALSTMRVHSVRLIAVDHDPGDESFLTSAGLLSGDRAPATQVVHVDGRDLTTLLSGDSAFAGQLGDTLDVALPIAGAGPIYVRSSGLASTVGGDTAGIEVLMRSGNDWASQCRIDPRELPSDVALSVSSGAQARLVFRGPHRLHAVGKLVVSGAGASVATLAPVTARHTAQGDVLGTLGTGGVDLRRGEYLFADFVPNAMPTGSERAWFMEVEAEELGADRAGGSGRSQPIAEPLPVAFALHAPRPNPTNAGTVIPFDLPGPAVVKLEVFDMQGRRIYRTVAWMPAGRHAWSWSPASSRGGRASPGLYAVRMIAGPHRDERKLVVLP